MIVALCAWLLLVFSAGLRRDPDRGRQDALTFIYFLTFSVLGVCLQALVIYLRPTTYDQQFLLADRALRLDPMAFMTWIGRHPHIGNFLGFVYESLPVVMVFTWMIEQNRTLRRAELIGGYLCFVCYLLLPAVGPGVFDWSTSTPAHGSMMLWRNCMPSMHFGWALLMARNSRSKVLAGFLWVFAGLTALGTIAVGQHYFIDLLAAAPYVLFVEWVTRRSHFPAASFLFGAGASHDMSTSYSGGANSRLTTVASSVEAERSQ